MPTSDTSSCRRSVRSARLSLKWTSRGSPTLVPIGDSGSNDEYGSWNTIWAFRRSRPSDLSASGSPSKKISPSVGSIEPQREPPERRLARTRLADEPERLARLHRERRVGHRLHVAA